MVTLALDFRSSLAWGMMYFRYVCIFSAEGALGLPSRVVKKEAAAKVKAANGLLRGGNVVRHRSIHPSIKFFCRGPLRPTSISRWHPEMEVWLYMSTRIGEQAPQSPAVFCFSLALDTRELHVESCDSPNFDPVNRIPIPRRPWAFPRPQRSLGTLAYPPAGYQLIDLISFCEIPP